MVFRQVLRGRPGRWPDARYDEAEQTARSSCESSSHLTRNNKQLAETLMQHKHSLSHNFFSFLDPTQTNPSLALSPSPAPVSSPLPTDKPQPVPMPLSAPPTLSPLPPSRSDPQSHLLLSLAVLEFLIGAGLWVEGQMSGWRCLAGVGYLVVFDAVGVGVSWVGREGKDGWRSVRRPYG